MADTPTNTQPPATDEATGVALHGDHPFNRRLRAESMSRAGVTSDEAGLVTDELIAETGERLKREEAAEKDAANALSKMKVAELDDLAAVEGIDLSGASTKAERIELIEAARAGSTIDNPPADYAGREGEGA